MAPNNKASGTTALAAGDGIPTSITMTVDKDSDDSNELNRGVDNNNTNENNENDNNNNGYGTMVNSRDRASRGDGTDRKPQRRRSRSPRPSIARTGSSFYDDARFFIPGTIPHSLVLAVTIGVVCGICAALYYAILSYMLDYVWNTLPEMLIVDQWPEWAYVFWIPIVGFIMALGVGVTVVYMGEPGDLPYTIKCVHEQAFVAIDHVLPMVCASQFSIVGGGSLGPEAPLVAICAAVGGFISRRIYQVEDRNLVRKHTLMGMAGALAAFFGCPLGGSLFALEVNSRFGIEYFEHTIEAIFAGEVCLTVFRGLAGLPIESIWEITNSEDKLEHASPQHVIYGLVLGLIGALIAYLFARLHLNVMRIFQKLDLLRNERAIARALLGATVILSLGVLIPHTMFWGEFEFQTIATMDASSTLAHIWPTNGGGIGFEMDSPINAALVGFGKLIAISFTVAGGYRGGFIFPLMATGAAFGRVIHYCCPFIPVQLCVLCTAAGVNVGITRTAMATTLIMAYLSGEQHAITALVASSFISLFATAYMPFIKTQIARADIDSSLNYTEESALVENPTIAPRRRSFNLAIPTMPRGFSKCKTCTSDDDAGGRGVDGGAGRNITSSFRGNEHDLLLEAQQANRDNNNYSINI